MTRRDARVLALEDRLGSLDVWILPTTTKIVLPTTKIVLPTTKIVLPTTKIVAMRWPSRRVGGRVICWTLGEPVASTFVFGGIRTGVRQ